jgi:hypothetical protein
MRLLQSLIVGFGLLLFANNLFAANEPERLFLPFLDTASQSNLTVTVSPLADEEPCPMEFTNVISNTNLFTPEEQKMIAEVLVKYKGVTTNSGPPGSVLVNSYKTNVVILPVYWVETNTSWNIRRTNEIWVSDFKYTNSEAQEEIRFGSGISAKFRNKSNDGYNASIGPTGNGALFNITEIKHDSAIGVLVRFSDFHPQGTTWDYGLADLSNGHLEEYMQMTNGMLLGKWFMWNVRSGGLILAAESKEPYDWNNHRTKIPLH